MKRSYTAKEPAISFTKPDNYKDKHIAAIDETEALRTCSVWLEKDYATIHKVSS